MSGETPMQETTFAGRRLVRSCVVRIYREEGDAMAGVVEDVVSGRSTHFHSMEELREALRAPSREPATAAR